MDHLNNDSYDVIVVGAGPVGLMAGRMLGLAGHRVLILERWPELYPLPRAVHFDHEIGRLLQSAGLADEVRGVSERVPDFYEWRNRDGVPLLKIDWSVDGSCGWPVASFFSQPDLEAVLEESVTHMPNVTLLRGRDVVALTESQDHVDVTVAEFDAQLMRSTDRTSTHRVQYVIGADGANSFVRSQMNVTMTDLGFYFDWLIVDTVPHEEREWSPMNWQLCDPARPTTIVSGGPGKRRWEFMRLPDETRDQLNTEETAWRLLEPWGRTRENTTMDRHAVYTFQARWADSWNQGRLLLAGDAAHLMPPFAGQGMCSGLRDAANLAWKLNQILKGVSKPDLLDTYTSERSAHLQHAISMSVALGRTICVQDEAEAKERDERMIAAGADPRTALPPMPPERLGAGALDETLTPAALQGTLAPQFHVSDGASGGLFDDVVGTGFTLIGCGVDPREGLSAEQLVVLDALQVRCVTIVDSADYPGTFQAAGAATSESRRVAAIDSAPADYFAANGVVALLVRPDFYLFGAATQPGDVPRLLDQLAHDLRLTTLTESAK